MDDGDRPRQLCAFVVLIGVTPSSVNGAASDSSSSPAPASQTPLAPGAAVAAAAAAAAAGGGSGGGGAAEPLTVFAGLHPAAAAAYSTARKADEHL